jgi:hypothetical protein
MAECRTREDGPQSVSSSEHFSDTLEYELLKQHQHLHGRENLKSHNLYLDLFWLQELKLQIKTKN